MLKNIPRVLSPELMAILMRMGHGDEIVIADGNFPAESMARRLVRADGHSAPELVDAILRFLPIDDFGEHPALVMQPVDPQTPRPLIWNDYQQLIQQHERDIVLHSLERFAFYERAKQAFAIVATGETAIYANLILRKGVVRS